MNKLSQSLFQSQAPFIALTAKSSIEVHTSMIYTFVLACTDSIISIPKGTRLFKDVFLEEEFFNKFKKVVFAILEDAISLSRERMAVICCRLKNYLTNNIPI